MSERWERREVVYAGHVQGVGFRFRTRQLADSHPVVGYVRNLSDGRVELVVEGIPAEVERFLQDVADEMRSYIRSVNTATLPASGEFSEFEIRT